MMMRLKIMNIIDYFEKNIKIAYAQYIFEKDIA